MIDRPPFRCALLALATISAALAMPGVAWARKVCVEEMAGVCLKYEERRDITPAERAEQALGLSRDDRRGIQAALRELGFYQGAIDGLYGRGTRGAIRDWQASTGQERTGYLSAAQASALSARPARTGAEDDQARRLFASLTGGWRGTNGEINLRIYIGNNSVNLTVSRVMGGVANYKIGSLSAPRIDGSGRVYRDIIQRDGQRLGTVSARNRDGVRIVLAEPVWGIPGTFELLKK